VAGAAARHARKIAIVEEACPVMPTRSQWPAGARLFEARIRGPILVAVLVASAVIPLEWSAETPITCFFRGVTGLPCPGCGFTRSFLAMGHLRFSEAFAVHPFGPPAWLWLAFLAVSDALTWLGRGPTLASLYARPARRLLYAIAVAWLAWGVARAIARV
jgi:hypothetical protein